MGRRIYPERNASESWHHRARHRRKSPRSERIDYLSLRRWWTFGARRRKPAKNGLQKRPLHGWRTEGLESRRIANNEVAPQSEGCRLDCALTKLCKLD